jgi:cell division protein FtsQ
MRRPPPLPAPETSGPASKRTTSRSWDDEAPARPPATGRDAGSVVPAVGADAPSESDHGDPAQHDPARHGGAPTEDVAPRRTGIRDVWRAARARRRALRREVRRFTVRSRRRRLAWLVGSAAVLLLIVGSVGVAYSPFFAVEKIEVLGTTTLPAATVENALEGQLGTPLPLVDASAVKAALVAFPLVESYTLEARPPHDLVVRIVERTPIGVIQTDAGWTLVDAAGVALETSPNPPEGRPILEITGGTSSGAFESAGLVMRALPDGIATQVTRIAATTRDDVTLTLASGTQVVWGAVEDTAQKALNLDRAMRARPGMSVYDVSSAASVVVR